MTVHGFTKGVLLGPFSYSLLRYCRKTFCEIRRQAMAHIVAEDWVIVKRDSVGPVRPRAAGQPQPMRVHEATIEKKGMGKQQPYETRKPQTRGRTREDAPPRHNFRVELKEFIVIPNIAKRLKMLPKTDKKLGPSKNA